MSREVSWEESQQNGTQRQELKIMQILDLPLPGRELFLELSIVI